MFPESEECIICGEETPNLICINCNKKIKLCNERSILNCKGNSIMCYSLAYYSNVMKELILRLKYRGDFACGEVLGKMMAELIIREDIHPDIITYVPSSRAVIKKRGYNQSKVLANVISKETGVMVMECLNKSNVAKDQIGLSTELRWKNLEQSYYIMKKIKIESKKILLVDDVVTTGATVSYCCNELIKGFPESITILTAAKSKL